MEKITLDNYEAILLDYSEGKLASAEAEALKCFILAHPELNINLDELTSLPYVWEQKSAIDFKQELKKTEEDSDDERLLNYLEGNLLPEQVAGVEQELARNPELAKRLALYRKTILTVDDSFLFDSKAELHKDEEALLLRDRFIAYVEDQLSDEAKQALEQDLATHPELQQQLNLILKTKLQVDADCAYPNKQELKKKPKTIALFSFRAVAASVAALLLLSGLVITWHVVFVDNNSAKEVAVHKSEKMPEHKGSFTAKHQAEHMPAPVNVANVHTGRTQSVAQAKQEKQNQPMRKNNPLISPAVVSTHTESATKAPEPEAQKQATVSETAPLVANATPEKEKTQSLPESSSKVAKENDLTHLDVIPTGEDTEETASAPAKKRFWQQLTHLAKRANQLGVKGIDGQEKPGDTYFLSFNSFSVEKK